MHISHVGLCVCARTASRDGFTTCVLFFTVIVNSSGGDTPSSYWDENYSQPYFDNSTKRDITVTIGQTAVLHCRVRNLCDRAVSFNLKFIAWGDEKVIGLQGLIT